MTRRTLARKTKLFWPLLLVVLLSDCTTKSAAVSMLSPEAEPTQVMGDVVRFTLAFNDRGPMGFSFGESTMRVLGILGFAVGLLILGWYRDAPRDSVLHPVALALVLGGALGNAWERVFSNRGVVDFIDVGLGTDRFYTFNVADIGITVGAVLLFVAFYRSDRRPSDDVEGAAV